MKIYSAHGINDFIICCGYRGYIIKEYFANYFLHQSDVTFNMKNNTMQVHHKRAEPWKITLVDTGENTMTGGRLLQIADYIKNEKYFLFTYGDGVSDIDITASVKFHRQHEKMVTLTATYPPGRFGALEIKEKIVESFQEKPRGDGALINGGFFVLSPKALDYIEDNNTVWEQEPLKILAENGELMAFQHPGFWQPLDTLRDKNYLEELWAKGKAPWKIWQ
jgi:glucose-1-phosphate cytidylyltransferase